MRSTKSRSPSTSRRICSGLTLKREKISLMISSPSRRTPRRMCSDSMTREPSFDASYRAKKRARRAFSLYFSNMVNWPASVCRQDKSTCLPRRRPGSYDPVMFVTGEVSLLHFDDSIAASRELLVVSDYNRRKATLQMTAPHQLENPLTRGEVEIAGRLVGE